jgi:hypothetical protein
MKINSQLPIKGKFSAYVIDNDTKKIIYEKSNQIQYAGSHDIAVALTNTTAVCPKLASIMTTIPQATDPGAAKGKTWNVSDWDVTVLSGTSFLATPSSEGQQQVIICQALFLDYLMTSDGEDGKYYEFALVLDTGNALAYEYVSGGISWGAGQTLQVIWTLYLGSA